MSAYFIKPASDKVTSALEVWSWLNVAGKVPFLVTAFADVFLESPDGIWFLDTLEGKLKRVCQTKDELAVLLAEQDSQDLYLFSGFVDRAVREGKILRDEECYDFSLHPVVGGEIDYSNVEKTDFLIALHIRGQLHERTRQLPEGTKIAKFVVVEETPKPWWKFWR